MAKVHPSSSHLINEEDSFKYDEEDEESLASSSKDYRLPTGNELMSGPIKSGGMSRTEKEIDFVIQNVQHRLHLLHLDQHFETTKLGIFLFAFISSMIGIILIFYGLQYSILFDSYKGEPTNYIAIVFGGIFCFPMIYFLSFLCFPNKHQKTLRKKIKKERKERRKPTIFNQIVEDAKKATEPPPRLIKVIARFRKKDYEIIGSTWKDFCEEFERVTGLPIERQLIRYQDEDLEIDLMKKMDEDYGLNNLSKVFIYNKGGLFTRDAPIRKQYEEILTKEQEKAEALRKAQLKQEQLDKEGHILSLFKRVSGNPEFQFKKPKKRDERRQSTYRQSTMRQGSGSIEFGSSEERGRISSAGISFSHKKTRKSFEESEYSGDESSGGESSRRESRNG